MDDSARPSVAVAASGASAVSWGAIVAGAAVAIAASLVLFALASGLDLASIASGRETSGGQVALAAIALIVTQWVSACLGGYVAGRLRTRWIGTHTHEVFFRDTAHGLITWCVATVFMASGFAAAASSGFGSHGRLLGPAGLEREHAGYAEPASAANGAAAQAEAVADEGDVTAGELVVPATRPVPLLMARAVADGSTLQGRFGSVARSLTHPVDLRPSADEERLRKDAALSSILTSLSMIIGAFIASVSGALGGRLRDEHP